MEPEEIKTRATRGVLALYFQTLVSLPINLVSFALLGALLSPGEIGIYFVVSALMRFYTIFTELGLGAALVQKPDLDKRDLQTVFTLQITLVLAVVIVAQIIAPAVSQFANLSPEGVVLYRILIITLVISSAKLIPSILLERSLSFARQIVPQLAETVVFNLLVVMLALKGFGVSAYSWAVLISALVGLPLYYLVSPWKVSFGFDQRRARKLFSFGMFYQGKNVLALIKDDLLVFFLSGLVGPVGIGYWGWAQRWAYSPFRFLVDSLTKVTFPAYARVQGRLDLLQKGIEKSLFAVSLTLFPTLALMASVVGKVLLLVPRYSRWEPALPSFYLLCATAAISALSNILVNVLDATGRVQTSLRLMIMWIVLTWVSTLILVYKFGFNGIAAGSLLVSLTLVVTIYLVKMVVPFRLLPSIWQPMLGSVVMGILVWFLLASFPISLASLFMVASIGVIIYLGMVYLLATKQIRQIVQAVLSSFGR